MEPKQLDSQTIKRIVAGANRRAKKRGVPDEINEADVEAVFERYGNTCFYCGGVPSGVDHVVAMIDRGPNKPFNLVPACWKCNKAKGRNSMVIFVSKVLELPEPEMKRVLSKLFEVKAQLGEVWNAKRGRFDSKGSAFIKSYSIGKYARIKL